MSSYLFWSFWKFRRVTIVHPGELVVDVGPGSLHVPQRERRRDLVHHQRGHQGEPLVLHPLQGELLVAVFYVDLTSPGYSKTGGAFTHCC